MIRALLLIAFVTIFNCNAYAASDYDACLMQENLLRAKEATQCSGLQYLLNPSGCYATRKSLKVFDEGKCARISRTEITLQAQPAGNVVTTPVQGSTKANSSTALPKEVKVKQSVQEQIVTPASTDQKLDACRKQEQELRLKESDLCSGIKYLLNPSACFSAKKQLKESVEGKCRNIGSVGNGAAQETAQKTVPAASPSVAPRINSAVLAPYQARSTKSTQKQVGDAEYLREENARMKAENERLKLELENMRKNTAK
jgi:hypothetical protein